MMGTAPQPVLLRGLQDYLALGTSSMASYFIIWPSHVSDPASASSQSHLGTETTKHRFQYDIILHVLLT